MRKGKKYTIKEFNITNNSTSMACSPTKLGQLNEPTGATNKDKVLVFDMQSQSLFTLMKMQRERPKFRGVG